MNEQRQKPITIGVAGGTGSGKTTVSEQIMERVGKEHIAYFPHDSYYIELDKLPPEDRARINFDHPDSLDTEFMIEQIKQVQNGQTIERPVYDFTKHTRADEIVLVEPQPVIMIEGILIFTESHLRDLMDIKVFVDTDADIRFIRRLRRDVTERGRDVDSVINQYMSTVRPMHNKFVEPSKRYADVIIPQGGFNTVAVDMIVDRIRGMLHQL